MIHSFSGWRLKRRYGRRRCCLVGEPTIIEELISPRVGKGICLGSDFHLLQARLLCILVFLCFLRLPA